MTAQIPPGEDGTDEVAHEDRRPAAGPHGVQADEIGTDGVSEFRRPATDRPPGHEHDLVAAAALPTVSVIVATRNRAHLLEPLVRAVFSDPGALELVIAVDGTDDVASTEVLTRLSGEHERLVHLQVDRGGQMLALERAVAVARGDIVLLLDDDVLPVTPLATGHAQWHARDSRDLVVVGYMPVYGVTHTQGAVASRIYASAYNGHCEALDRDPSTVLESLWMGNVSLSRECCLEVGLFATAFDSSYHTDRDFGYRLADHGCQGVFDRSLRAEHLHARSPEAFLHDAFRQGAGLATLHRLYPDRLGTLTSEMIGPDLPRPLRWPYRALASTPTIRTYSSRILLRLAIMAGRVRLAGVEEVLAKMAQHLMHWHGARTGEQPHAAGSQLLPAPTSRPTRK